MQYRDDNVELARARGWVVVPARVYKSAEGWRQHPLTGWPDVTETPELSAWQPNDGIACVLGPSRVIDIDLDSAVARDLAPRFLRPTATYGRPGRERTHWLYECSAEQAQGRTQQFRDPLGMLLELRRGHGQQTLLPGTRKGWGTDTITVQEWTDDAEIVAWEDRDEVRVHELAVACYLALGDAEGARHATALAAAGVLARAGWSMEAATRVITAACEFRGDSNLADRVRAIEATYDTHARGEAVASWAALRDAGVDPRRLAELGKVLHCGRARIDLACRLDEVVGRSIAALSDVPVADARVFRHDTSLVRHDLTSYTVPALRIELSQAMDFIRTTKDGEKVVHPPRDVVECIAAGDVSSVREIVGVWRVPLLRDDGSVVTTRGYDVESKLWLDPIEVGPIGSTRDDALTAVDTLLTAVDGALWGSESDALGWLAHVLTVVARPLCPTVPAFIYSGHPGSGKSTLARCAGIIGGRARAMYSPHVGDDAEIGRGIDAHASEAAIVLDNLHAKIVSAALESAITSGVIKVRRLYVGPVNVTLRAVLSFTLQGGERGGDWGRRCVPVHLDQKSRGELDNTRDLERDVEASPALTGAALTIVSAWLKSKESSGAQSLASFQRWSTVVAGALHWLGLGDPVADTREEAEGTDDSDADVVDALQTALAGGREQKGMMPSEMLGVGGMGFSKLAQTLKALWPGELTPTRLSSRLGKIRPLADGRRLVRKRTKEGVFWRVEGQKV